MEEKKPTGYPSIDKPWLKYYSEEAIYSKVPECTMYEYVLNNNKDHYDDIALVYFGKKITSMSREIQFICSTLSAQFWMLRRFGSARLWCPKLMASRHMLPT